MLNADRTDCIAVPDWAGSGATTLKLNFPQSSIIHDLSFTNGSFAPKAEVPSKSAFDPRTDVGVLLVFPASALCRHREAAGR
jgi:hypothetical protein